MTRLVELHRAVQATLASKRLGTPVFVRYLWQSPDKAAGVLARLTVLTAQVRDWLGQPLHRVYALGALAAGQVSLTLECRGGATALVCWTGGQPRSGDGQPRGGSVDVLLLGNHGALYHDAGLGNLCQDATLWPEEKADPALLALIEKALRTGQPEIVEGGNQP